MDDDWGYPYFRNPPYAVWFLFTNINPQKKKRGLPEMRAFLTGGDGSTVDDEVGFKSCRRWKRRFQKPW